MDLLLDIFGFASVLLSGVARTAQCLTIGSMAFFALIAVPAIGNKLVSRSRIVTRRLVSQVRS